MKRLYCGMYDDEPEAYPIETDTRGKARAWAASEVGCDFTDPKLKIFLAREVVCRKHNPPLKFYMQLSDPYDDTCGYCEGRWGY